MSDARQEQIIGHKRILTYLSMVYAEGKLAHAYLFIGQPSVGKTTVAGWLTRMVMCEEPISNSPCGTCNSCRQQITNSHPDVIQVDTQQGEEITVELIRHARFRLSMRPLHGTHSVVVVKDAERFSLSAANALLKTLEEPPGYAVLILTTSHPELLPPTIRSRCTSIIFHSVHEKEICSALEHQGLSLQKAKRLAEISAGAPGAALTYAKNEALLNQFQEDLDLLLELVSSGIARRFESFSSITDSEHSDERERCAVRFLHWQFHLRQVVYGRLNIPRWHTPGTANMHHAFKNVPLSKIIALMNVCIDSMHWLRQRISPRLLYEHFALNI